MDLTTATLDSLNFRLTIDVVQKMEKEEIDVLKLAAQTNLRFLLNCILRPPKPKKFPSLVERVHGKIIDALPKPSPFQEIDEWSSIDEFVVLASRGMLKSTIGMGFLTQVILCAPDVRILIMSGKIDKAESILAGARNPFYANEVLRFLFPEWAIDEDAIKVGEFITPKRNPELNYRDATIETASFDSIKAGWHGELVFFDDATNEINSNNLENCEKTHGQYDDTDPLMEPGTPRVFLGTKWLDDDLPEYIRRKGLEDLEKTGQQSVSYFFLPAWTLKTEGTAVEVEARLNREKTGSLTPDDVNLTWPEKLNAKMLFKMYRKNRIDFYKQYLLDASIEQQHSFLPEVLAKQTITREEFNRLPKHDLVVVAHWDLASVFSGHKRKSESDYSCCIIAVFQKSTGNMYVVDALLEHFNSGDDIANAVIKMYRTAAHLGPVGGHSMEDVRNARVLGDSIDRLAKEKGISVGSMFWMPAETTPNAKNVRIALLASAMKSGFVFLLNDIPFFDDIKSQFERWTVDSKRRKDDGPDCIAEIWQHYKSQISADTISIMQTEGPVLSWEPELAPEIPDPHADEADADIAWLNSFTTPHA
jgi:predicted phage terminase large subunit-like protein